MQNAEVSDTAILIPRFTPLSCKDRGTEAGIQCLFLLFLENTSGVIVVRSTNSVDISEVLSIFWFIPFPSTP